ncbi:MAG: hypothetical protein KF900_13675 [Bacteroidetes bacterium]|nr:hypothetical protein [Bacteroidota bacterium]
MRKPIIGLIYETENIRIYGDTTIERDKFYISELKFEPYISFDDFKVNKIDNKRHAPLDLKSSNGASNFRTRLREGYNSDSANFAGHYTFVWWGCGSPCQSSLIIDRQTGKIYGGLVAANGYDYRVNSRMMIVNPPDTNGFYTNVSYLKPLIYVFNEQTKTFDERQPKIK